MPKFKNLAEITDGLLDDAVSRYRSDLAGYVNHRINDKLCESPIERIMLAALMTVDWENWFYAPDWNHHPFAVCHKPFTGMFDDEEDFRREALSNNEQPLWIFRQYKEGPYRADFAIFFFLEGFMGKVIVECDGHDFHEKTKEQAARDKSRDRFFTSKGWRVLRFTGSEIYKNAASCASEVSATVNQIASDMLAEKYRIEGV